MGQELRGVTSTFERWRGFFVSISFRFAGRVVGLRAGRTNGARDLVLENNRFLLTYGRMANKKR